MRTIRLITLAALLVSCGASPLSPPFETPPPPRVPGPPQAGVAEGDLDAIVGSPLGGYTDRCTCFGNSGDLDGRDSAVAEEFNPSVGVQTRPRGKVVWLENGDQDLILLKTDSIYAFEGIAAEVGRRLSELLGRDLNGKAILTTTHSHAMPANWDKGFTWFLGGDRFNREVFERQVAALTELALAAHDDLEPVSVGLGQQTNWDPEDRVYRDRRDNNDNLAFFDDIPAGPYKDPYLSVLRVDAVADGAPKAMVVSFGIHGTVEGGDSQMISVEAAGHVELALEEALPDDLLVLFVQGGAGDASPAGSDRSFARMEVVGTRAAPAVLDLWNQTPTSSNDMLLEVVTQGIEGQREDFRVQRPHGDLVYAPYASGLQPDQEIFGEEGEVLTPIDEFNTEVGAVFCGEDEPFLPGTDVGGLGPYASCATLEVMAPVVGGFFDATPEEISLPLVESTRISAAVAALGPLPQLQPDGRVEEDELLLAFLPGETTALYSEQVRRRTAAETAFQHVLPIGYSVDHIGYLLLPEDWLQGGYEANINVWGPLQAEYLFENMLEMTQEWLESDVVEPMRPDPDMADTSYATQDAWLERAADRTPDAGTRLSAVPDGLLVLPGVTPDLFVPDTVQRAVDMVQVAWEGGDPLVDHPRVTLERLDGTEWVAVTLEGGRVVDDTRPDIVLTWTPDPGEDASAEQAHRWWAGWQVVGTGPDRMGLPEGTYRLFVEGQRATDATPTWPRPTEDYSFASAEFRVAPAPLTLSWEDGALWVSVVGPEDGFRMLDSEGESRGHNPVRSLTLAWATPEGVVEEGLESTDVSGGKGRFLVTPPSGATAVQATDPWGNTGTLDLASAREARPGPTKR